MPNSKLHIEFNQPFLKDDSLTIKFKDLASSTPNKIHVLRSIWKYTRTKSGEVERDPDTNYTKESTSHDFLSQFLADNSVLFIPFNIGSNTLSIEGKRTGIEFISFETSNNYATGLIDNHPYVPVNVLSVIYTESANKCTHVIVNVTSTTVITNVTSPVSLTPNAKTFSFEVLRGSDFTLSVTDGITPRSITYTPPEILEIPIVTIQGKPTGAGVYLKNGNTNLTLEWSLNGTDYSPISFFTGILQGNRTAYVKDQFNCVNQINFVVKPFSPFKEVINPVFYYSDSNSVRMKDVEIWDNNRIYKHVKNTLSFEENKDGNVHLNTCRQQWLRSDVLLLELSTNYEKITVNVISEGVVSDIPITKKTNNLNRKDARDARIYERKDGKTGIYFLTGNIYDYGTSNVTGGYVGSEMPEWAKIGNTIFVTELGAYFEIQNKVYDFDKGQDVLILENGYIGTEKITTVSCIYNIVDFEVYLITLDVSHYDCFQFYIEVEDSRFAGKSKLSEIQEVSTDTRGLLEIKAKDLTNSDVFYPVSDVYHKIRVPYSGISSVGDDSRSIEKFDTEVVNTGVSQYNKSRTTIYGLTTGLSNTVFKILGRKNVSLNGIFYTLDDGSLKKERVGRTNTYNISFEMYETVDSELQENIELVFPVIYSVPTLLRTLSGKMLVNKLGNFLKIK